MITSFSHRVSSIGLCCILAAGATQPLMGEGVTIGDGGKPHESALLDLRSNERGLLIPRVELSSKAVPVANPALGLLVWNTSDSGAYPVPGFYYWDGSDWKKLLLEGADVSVRSLTIDGVAVEIGSNELNALAGVEGNIQSRLSGLESKDAELGVDLGDINLTLVDLQSQLDLANAAITALQSEDAAINSRLDGHDADVVSLLGQITSNDTDIAALQAQDSVISGRLDGHDADIVSLQSQITSNDSDIAALQATDTDLQSQISANESDIATLQSDVAAAQADIDGFDDSLKGLTAAAVEQLQNIGNVAISAEQWENLGASDQATSTISDVTFAQITSTGSIVLEGSTVDDNQLQIQAVDPTAPRTILFPDADGTVALLSDITSLGDTVSPRLDGLDVDVADLQTADAALGGRIDNADASIALLQDQDLTINSRLDGHDADIASLQTQITSNDGDIAALQSQDLVIDSRLYGHDADIVSLQSQITSNDTDIAALQAIDTDLQSQILANESEIATLQSDVAAAQADIDGFDDSLKNLTAAEVEQLLNIGETTISAEQWVNLGASDQATASTSNVIFAKITSTGVFALEGATVDEFQLQIHAVDPTDQRVILFPDADGTVALLSDVANVDETMSARLDDLDNQIATLGGSQSTHDDLISELSFAVVALEGQVLINGNDIADLHTSLANVEGEIVGLAARVIDAGEGLIASGTAENRVISIQNGGVGTDKLAADAVTDDKVVDSLTINGGNIINTPVAATTLVAGQSLTLPSEVASLATPEVGSIRYNSAGYLEFYHEVSPGEFQWVPVGSYAP